ncbi:hypothetical protein B0H13DRAFT_1877199 [Mycena leptocephala]|nr:hypothetical protein B0H13DRAFT_1877199 [Mycena leptocephala]
MSGVIKANSFIQVKSVASQQVNIHVNFSAPRTLGAEWGYALYTPDVPRASDPGSMMLLEKMWLTGVGAHPPSGLSHGRRWMRPSQVPKPPQTALSPLSALLACNVAFEKHVSIHFTLDGWSTTSDVYARYVDALCTLHARRVQQSPARLGSFHIPHPAGRLQQGRGDAAGGLSARELVLAVHFATPYVRADGVAPWRGEWWDNNAGGTTAWVSARCIGTPACAAKLPSRTYARPSPYAGILAAAVLSE